MARRRVTDLEAVTGSIADADVLLVSNSSADKKGTWLQLKEQMAIRVITKAQRALLTPFSGQVIYQTDNTEGLRIYVSGAWKTSAGVADP